MIVRGDRPAAHLAEAAADRDDRELPVERHQRLEDQRATVAERGETRRRGRPRRGGRPGPCRRSRPAASSARRGARSSRPRRGGRRGRRPRANSAHGDAELPERRLLGQPVLGDLEGARSTGRRARRGLRASAPRRRVRPPTRTSRPARPRPFRAAAGSSSSAPTTNVPDRLGGSRGRRVEKSEVEPERDPRRARACGRAARRRARRRPEVGSRPSAVLIAVRRIA